MALGQIDAVEHLPVDHVQELVSLSRDIAPHLDDHLLLRHLEDLVEFAAIYHQRVCGLIVICHFVRVDNHFQSAVYYPEVAVGGFGDHVSPDLAEARVERVLQCDDKEEA